MDNSVKSILKHIHALYMHMYMHAYFITTIYVHTICIMSFNSHAMDVVSTVC